MVSHKLFRAAGPKPHRQKQNWGAVGVSRCEADDCRADLETNLDSDAVDAGRASSSSE